MGLGTWWKAPRSFRLPDGSRLTLREISYGTNVPVSGSLPERLLGNRIPAGGINLLGWKLRRPRELPLGFVGLGAAPPITAWLELSSATHTAQELQSRLHAREIIARSRDGRQYANGYQGSSGGMSMILSANTVLWRVPISAFPRTEKEFALQLRTGNGGEALGAAYEFRIPNPSPVTPVALVSRPLPQTNQLGELQVILDEVQGTNNTASVGFRLRCPPALSHDWRMDECWIEDEEGNRQGMQSWSSSTEPSLQTSHGLPADKPWRIVATLNKLQDLDKRELIALDFGVTNQISVTNSGGQEFRCEFDGLNLKVKFHGWAGATHSPNLAIRALDPTGEEIVFGERQWVWTGRDCRSMGWTMPRPGIQMQLVMPKAVRTEFVAMPAGK